MSQKQYNHMGVTDLDGTLLNAEHLISKPNLKALHKLRANNVCTVAATGRSIYSLRKVITVEMPFDYVIFSTGAGIMNWRTQKIILARHIDAAHVQSTFKKLIKLNEDFMYHAPIPDNHRFIAVKGKGLPDFYRRIGLYKDFGFEWDGQSKLPWNEGTQFLVIADEKEESMYLSLINQLAPLKVVRTTSPLDHLSLWFEVFSPEVSKGSAVQFIIEMLGLDTTKLMIVGNDYNDIDMLKLTDNAFVTSNAPGELINIYKKVSDNNNHGFAEAVEQWLSDIQC